MNRFEVQGRYFDDLFEGRKIAEGRRLNSRMNKETKEGDIITIYRGDDEFNCEIIRKEYYSSARDMLVDVGVRNMLPDKETIAEGLEVYEKFGVVAECVAIFIRVL